MAESERKTPADTLADVPGAGNQEAFFSRWSRLKEETRQAPPERVPDQTVDPKAPAPELPPLDKLTFESDYSAFFHPKVDEDMRRAALKKLFSDPRFNVMDGLDVYVDDYSKTEPIPAAMLAGLRQAQKILEWAKDDADQREREKSLPVVAGAQAVLQPPTGTSVMGGELQTGVPDSAPAASDSASERAKT